jgi:hypothetical protein
VREQKKKIATGATVYQPESSAGEKEVGRRNYENDES